MSRLPPSQARRRPWPDTLHKAHRHVCQGPQRASAEAEQEQAAGKPGVPGHLAAGVVEAQLQGRRRSAEASWAPLAFAASQLCIHEMRPEVLGLQNKDSRCSGDAACPAGAAHEH